MALLHLMSSEVKCEHCGATNPAVETRCRLCGQPLPETSADGNVCPQCGIAHAPSAHNTCISCGWDFGKPKHVAEKEEAKSAESCEHWSEKPAHTQRSAMIDVAGILILMAGALGIAHALLSTLPGTSSDILVHYENIIPAGEVLDNIIQDNPVVGAMVFVAGALAMGMSMSVFRRGSLKVAIAGAVCGILAIGFLFGAFFSLVGLIVLAASRREFLLECS